MAVPNSAAEKSGVNKIDAANTGAVKAVAETASDKLAEKRRALGRGLESLLPGPRVVVPAPTLPQNARKDGGPSGASGQSTDNSPGPVGLAGTPVAPSSAAISAAGSVDSLQAASGQSSAAETVFTLALDLIDENPYQTRRDFNEQALRELAESIITQGVMQPVVVRPGKEGRFVLILGERRLRASRMADMGTIPAIVTRVSEQQAAEMTVVENLQRADLNCVEQAQAFDDLSRLFKLTQEQIGDRVGLSREQVANYVRLLTLPESVIGALQRGVLHYSHARTLLRLKDNAQIWKLAQRVMEEKMSVAKLEELVEGLSFPGGSGEKRQGEGRWVDPNVKAAQRTLESILGMRVRIQDKSGRGRITIEYGTLEDFDRVVTMLKGKVG